MTEEKIIIYRTNGQITKIHIYTPKILGQKFSELESRLETYNNDERNKEAGYTAEIVNDQTQKDLIHYFKKRPEFDKDDLLDAIGQIAELADYLENALEDINEK